MLTKSAKELAEEHRYDPLIAGALAYGASVPFDYLSSEIGKNALKDMPPASLFLPFKLRNKLGRDVELIRGGMNAYDPLRDVIHHDGSMAIAHEFGHASSPYRKFLGKHGLSGLNLTNFINKKYTALPVAMAVHSAADEDNRTLSGAVVGALGAAQAAQLYEEGHASLRGLDMLKGEVSPEDYAKAKKAFMKAFGSYAVPAIGATTAAALIGNAVKAYRNRNDDN